MQVIRCRVCKAHAFSYDGDIRTDFVASKATLPDGTKPAQYSLVTLPCGHPINVTPRITFYIEGEEE
jgi:hypothetical protein